MMVPFVLRCERKQTKFWVVMGWATSRSWLFLHEADRHGFDPKGRRWPTPVRCCGSKAAASTWRNPESAEVYVTKLLNRDEFREHCDRYRTRSAILDHLK